MKVASVAFAAVLVELTACGSSPAGGSGRVEYQVNGGPVSGAKVKGRNGSIVTTGADGRFAVAAGSGSYDVTAVSADGRTAAVYAGLTRTDPIISIPLEGPGESVLIHSALVTGQFFGGIGTPIPLGHGAAAFFTGPLAAEVRIANTSLNPDGTYTVLLNWRGDANLTGTLRVIEWLVDSTGFPASFEAAASIPIAIASGERSAGKDIHLAAVGNLRVTGTTSLAPGYVLFARTLTASFPPSNGLTLGFDSTQGAAFDFPAFDLQGGVFNLTALAQDPSGAVVQAWRAGFSPAAPVALNVPAAPAFLPPSPSQPFQAAGTVVSWTPLGGAVYDVLVRPQTGGAILRVVTSDTTFQLPDLTAMGFSWPRATSYEVSLLASAPLSPDDIAGGTDQPSLDHDGVLAAPAGIVFSVGP